MCRNVTLQVNTRGAWRNLMEFDEARLAEVRRAVGEFARVMGADAKWCFVHPDGHREWLETPPEAVPTQEDAR